MLAFLNFSAIGIPKSSVAELGGSTHLDGDAALRVIEAHRNLVRGLKVRPNCAATGRLGLEPVRRGRAVARHAGLPLLIHDGEPCGIPEAWKL